MTREPSHEDTANSPWGFLSSLRVRLLLLVLIAVLPALGLVIYNAVEQRTLGLSVAEQEAFRVARLAATRQDERLEGARQLLLTLSQLQEIRNLSEEGSRFIFASILVVNPRYDNLALWHTNGTIVAAGSTNYIFPSIGRQPFIMEAASSRKLSLDEFMVVPGSTQAVLHVGFPVVDQSDQVVGVVSATFNLDWIYSLYEDSQLPEGSSFTVYDKHYITLARRPDPDNEYVGQRIGSSSNTNQASSRSGPPSNPRERFEVRKGENVSQVSGRDGIQRLYTSTRLGKNMGTNSVRVTFGIPLSFALADANRMFQRNLMFLVSATFLALMAAWYGGNLFVLRRVRSLLKATVNLRSGDLSARAQATRGAGELDQLARTFNDMAEELEQEFASRHQAQQALKSLNEDLEKRVDNRTHALQRSNEDLQQFAYVASHDLKEPLRMISSYLELLQKRYKEKLDNDAQDFIGYAVDGAQRMHKLIDDLLAYSRVETRAREFEWIKVDDILKQVTENLKVTIEENQATINHDSLPMIEADPSQMTQLFQNLVGNAIKFKGDKPPRIDITSERQGDFWQFTVKDNGIGIDPDHFQRIFVIFQRLHTRQQYPGTGIGLSICKKIVERHGGSIRVESAPGEGTRFSFTMPVKKTDHPEI